MKMLRTVAVALGLLVVLNSTLFGFFGGKYNYITAEETAALIRTAPESVVIVDIQEKPGFDKEHLKGAVDTYAYPVKTDAEKAALAAVLPSIKPGQKVVIVCPRGGGGADRAYDFYLENGISKDQLFTLKGGQEKWPRAKISDVLAQ
ncbi:rhodanese-like domain-containing protein [Sulfurospirillum sp. T05]|uniref:Rhodanese-like domain-containing protein n=1 Tax=Sulfurospirillum tamanense TaxID=2813362 RepID=A0ABS2WTV1_9BACT|nr:rhodanese-like domain-containing protein [Sulfurospirillum tamanensis]MBE0496172.1 rhodanese-like domain-containing protein [Campylobacterales bacterium]MBN2965062.1 rhodanese-like domain-containing protein [Sulfurospirillum tamanensis]